MIMRKIGATEVAGALMVFLFAYAALSKLLDYPVFIEQISKSPLIPGSYGRLFGAVVILVELMCVLLLLHGRYRIGGFYLSLFLMTLFSAYIFYILNIGYYIPCSCGGILERMGWKPHLYFNLFFVLVSFVGIIKTRIDL